jgi:hypothetical protein
MPGGKAFRQILREAHPCCNLMPGTGLGSGDP